MQWQGTPYSASETGSVAKVNGGKFGVYAQGSQPQARGLAAKASRLVVSGMGQARGCGPHRYQLTSRDSIGAPPACLAKSNERTIRYIEVVSGPRTDKRWSCRRRNGVTKRQGRETPRLRVCAAALVAVAMRSAELDGWNDEATVGEEQ